MNARRVLYITKLISGFRYPYSYIFGFCCPPRGRLRADQCQRQALAAPVRSQCSYSFGFGGPLQGRLRADRFQRQDLAVPVRSQPSGLLAS